MEITNIMIQLSTVLGAMGIIWKVFYDKALKPMELQNIKTDLVNFISDIENGMPKSSIQILNAYELYDRYTNLGGNSYVHSHWDKLREEGKI